MGEFEFLAKLRERLPPNGPRVELGSGDDAAITVPSGATATSVDAIVEGVHFRRGEAELETIGRKALSTALSDLAAMGAEPGEAYVVLGAPAELREEDFDALVDGLLEVATATGTTLAGGDLTRAAVISLAVTVVGHAARAEDFVTRAGAEPGELLVVTGEIGGAAAGRLLLDDSSLAGAVSDAAAAALRARQLDPTPRLDEGRSLAAAGARAMIDLSDGLAGDAGHLSHASAVSLQIDAGALPIAAGVAEIAAAAGLDPLQLAVSGGEDYELLAALPPERLGKATATTLTPIGQVKPGEGVEIRLPGGGLLAVRGHDHFAGPKRESPSAAPERRGD